MKLSQKRQMQATLPWWIAVQKTINDFAEMIEQSPTAQFEKADEKASQLKDMYENVQKVPCPPEADAAYTCTTRAILNLFMCYEALENFQWTQADVFYGRATSEWVLATYNLQSAGLMKRAV